jgi:hypothetical protein
MSEINFSGFRVDMTFANTATPSTRASSRVDFSAAS